MYRIESLMSARLFLSPQLVGDRIYFISNISGHLSLYAMDYGGSVPEPLLPSQIALQNPHLIGGESFKVFPKLGKILVMIDKDGDENYQPMLIPMDGGYPEPSFNDYFSKSRCHLLECDLEKNIIYLVAESRESAVQTGYKGNLRTGELAPLRESPYGAHPSGHDKRHERVIVGDSYMVGDHVLYLWEKGKGEARLLYGTPLENRTEDTEVQLNAINSPSFVGKNGLLFSTALFDDHYGLGFFELDKPDEVKEVKVKGVIHKGDGELEYLHHLEGNRYLVQYNIDGCTWMYEGEFDKKKLTMRLDRLICGKGILSNGMVQAFSYDADGDRYVLSFSTATSPTQIFTVEGKKRKKVYLHTNERVLGIPESYLSSGEDASFTSFDGLRVSARLYLPAEELGYTGARPVVYYIHGGPQGQERPDFGWFSMPLIQYLTLNGFAVFVPNVRGSTGYGLSYTKHVDRDWGGQDRLDHVQALEVLAKDSRLDVKRTGVVGRSYGGYMTLTLVGRHPELWSAAVDMFGPYDLMTFMERIPPTWKPYFIIALGDPEKDKEFLVDRSPKTHIDNLACPMLVIQGRNDPRVVAAESEDLVKHLKKQGKDVDLLLFENEGHDVLKYENRVRCYNAITEFFVKYLKP